MRNQKLFALTTNIQLLPECVVTVVSAFFPTKKEAKTARKMAVKAGIFQLMGEIVEIEPSDWAITLHDPNIANSHPLPIAKGMRFYAEAEHCAGLFKQILPSRFIVDVVKFDETEAYKILEQGEAIEKQLANSKGAFYA